MSYYNEDQVLIREKVFDYIKYVQLTKGRRKQYYKDKSKVPKKYKKDTNFVFKNGYLINKKTGEKVIKNARTYNKPRIKKIKGQDIWRGIDYNLRSKIAEEMRKYFYNIFSKYDKIDESKYPIGIEIVVFDHIDEGEDIDNLCYWYRKTLHDALSGNVEFIKTQNGFKPDKKKYPKEIIEDDSKYFVQGIPADFIPIDKEEEPFMLITIYTKN